jgi:hypothetical protein
MLFAWLRMCPLLEKMPAGEGIGRFL